ncbi:unnamed protein product [Adineta ricciae]|uniref:Uncharacterized protein n=1 Tax=Adineta ricciae TaxID=249248 RepID=A0A813WNR9_ADIRI|nr:unnamed protein product [Adineta ricciae]
MIKSEQLRFSGPLKELPSGVATVSIYSQSSPFQSTRKPTPQRSIDPQAIDISSIKGRFAWEKITLGDTYMPVIFRGPVKYFCVKMLEKILRDYPNDAIHHPTDFQYRKPIDLYVPTTNEIILLNRINANHSHWTYTRQTFTSADELVRVSDFLSFYEHLLVHKQMHIPRAPSVGSLRQILPQPRQSAELPVDQSVNMSNGIRKSANLLREATSRERSPSTAMALPRERTLSLAPKLIPTASTVVHSSQPVPPSASSSRFLQHSSKQAHERSSLSSNEQLAVISLKDIDNSTISALPQNSAMTQASSGIRQPSTLTAPTIAITSSSPDATSSSSSPVTSRKRSAIASEMQIRPTIKQSTSIPRSLSPVSKPPRLNYGWLQINKLYTPYVSSSSSNHHLYKIPVSLLTFYELLKTPANEHNTNESKEASFPFEHTLVTPQEIELINELCLKQNIKPFSIDTKLIDLVTFYHYSSANILFVKELPLNEPKLSICRDWPLVVQINGGICRLRNIATLHEQTVPFIGNNLLKTFIISSQCISTATLTTPTASELEFLQLILFFSNMSISLRNAKLIDIESVQKEYNVDLILLFNDKFPLNVLNYQNQDTRPSTSQPQATQSESTAATNTFAESTPPPSPPSPVPVPPQTTTAVTATTTAPSINSSSNVFLNPPSQLPLTAGSSSSSTANLSNRYKKTIVFHGHSMTTYTCSGLGSNAQRECISLETKLLRLLRAKNINRFRPQNQQSMNFTRLIDIKDVGKHWDYIRQGMQLTTHSSEVAPSVPEPALPAPEPAPAPVAATPLLETDTKASTSDNVGDDIEKDEETCSIKTPKSEKRPLETKPEEDKPEELPDAERHDKRVRLSRDNDSPQSIPNQSTIVMATVAIEEKSSSMLVTNKDNDNRSQEDVAKHVEEKKNTRISKPKIRIIRQKSDKKTVKNSESLLDDDPTSSKSSISLAKPSVSIKKKIRLNRKRPTPCIRSKKESVASWVQKYNIEECYIRLDLCDPAYKPRKN